MKAVAIDVFIATRRSFFKGRQRSSVWTTLELGFQTEFETRLHLLRAV